MQRWVFDAEQAKPYVEKISSAQESPLVLNQHQQKDRVDDVVKQAIAEVFSGESGQAYARRLEEMALYFAATERVASAPTRPGRVACPPKRGGERQRHSLL